MEREEKRLEQFQQLRKEIRGSQDYLVVGIDISKDTHNALMRTIPGKIVYRRLIFNNTREGLVASSRDKHFVGYFTEQLRGREKEKGIKTKKRVKLAAKMLMIAWTLMKKQESFDPRYLLACTQQSTSHKSAGFKKGAIPKV
jgi:hypothetical protein